MLTGLKKFTGTWTMKMNTNDHISRQATIDYINRAIPNWSQDKETALDCLNNMPSEHRNMDEWCTDCKEYDQERHCCPRWNRVIRNTVEELKAEHRWIPVTERLPEENGIYIVTYKIPHEGKDYETFGVGVKHFIGRLKMWSMNDLSTPIAWMPLPEPYKGEK